MSASNVPDEETILAIVAGHLWSLWPLPREDGQQLTWTFEEDLSNVVSVIHEYGPVTITQSFDHLQTYCEALGNRRSLAEWADRLECYMLRATPVDAHTLAITPMSADEVTTVGRSEFAKRCGFGFVDAGLLQIRPGTPYTWDSDDFAPPFDRRAMTCLREPLLTLSPDRTVVPNTKLIDAVLANVWRWCWYTQADDDLTLAAFHAVLDYAIDDTNARCAAGKLQRSLRGSTVTHTDRKRLDIRLVSAWDEGAPSGGCVASLPARGDHKLAQAAGAPAHRLVAERAT